ncbi:MAG: hypothetical protein ACJ79H_21025 [Myxococcales bacterium]
MQPEAEWAEGSTRPALTVAAEAIQEAASNAPFQGAAVQLVQEPRTGVDEPDRSAVLTELAEKIRAKLGSELPEVVQIELATLLGLVPEANGSNSLCLCQFEIAIDALLADTPKLELARGLRMKFEEHMWEKRFGGRFLNALPTTRVVFGLVITSLLLVPALIWSTYMHFADEHPDRMDADFLVLVCCFGAFGAVTSIMVRLRSFDSVHAPPLTLFLTGLFKPLIGALFAAFALVLVEARLINLPEPTLVYFAMALAFVAGFSERFGQDLTGIVATRMRPARSKRDVVSPA